jgi:hypothetical protein
MTLYSPLHSCLYRTLQCAGKLIQICIYLCDMISLIVIKCVVYKELKLWLRLKEIIFFFCITTGIVSDCFIEWDVESQAYNSERNQ